MKKKFLSLLFVLCLACGLCSFAAAEGTRTFVDSTGTRCNAARQHHQDRHFRPAGADIRICPRA